MLSEGRGSVLDYFFTSSTFFTFLQKTATHSTPRQIGRSGSLQLRVRQVVVPRTAKKNYCMLPAMVRQEQGWDFDKKSPFAEKQAHFARFSAISHLPQRQSTHELRHFGRRGPSGNTCRYSIAYPDGNFGAGGNFRRAGLTKPDAFAAVQDPEHFRQPIPGHPGWPLILRRICTVGSNVNGSKRGSQ